MIELGVLGIVGACLLALIYKVVSLFRQDSSTVDRPYKKASEELLKRNEAGFKAYQLAKKKSQERQDILLKEIATNGVTSTLLEELEAEQERLKHELASIDLDRNGSK